MKVAKLIVLLGGLLGVLAFFVPLATVEGNNTEVSVSGYDVFTGMGALEAMAAQASTPQHVKASTYETLSEIKGIILVCFLPGALLALIGLVALVRRRYGRAGGLIAIVLGVMSFLVFMALSRGAAEAQDGSAGAAVYLIAASGLLGIAGGSLATVNPDRGPGR
jgi:hypothetical protein